MLSRVIAKNIGDVFLKHTVVSFPVVNKFQSQNSSKVLFIDFNFYYFYTVSEIQLQLYEE